MPEPYNAKFRIPGSPCPACGMQMDAASGRLNRRPEVGDVTVCIGCAAGLVFGEGLVLRAMTDDELLDLPAEVRGEMFKIQTAVQVVNKGRAR